MSLLSNALTKCLSELHWKQKDLADKTGLATPQINRYVRGVASRMEIESLAKILAVLPPEYQAEVLIAFLRDETPDGFAEVVSIVSNQGRIREIPPRIELPAEMNPDLRAAVVRLAELAIDYPDIEDMISKFLKLMEPRRT